MTANVGVLLALWTLLLGQVISASSLESSLENAAELTSMSGGLEQDFSGHPDDMSTEMQQGSEEDTAESIASLLPPPIVLISADFHKQSSHKLRFTFEWSEDVMGNVNPALNFGPEDIELTDSKGNFLSFDRLVQKDEVEPQLNSAYYGEVVARVPPLLGSAHRFIGTLQVPKSGGWIEVYIPEYGVCSAITGLCNSGSNVLRVDIMDTVHPCVSIKSSEAPHTSEPIIPLTFDFASDVATGSFTPMDVVVYAYDLGYSSVNRTAGISDIVGGPRRFYATVDAPVFPLDHLEIFVLDGQAEDMKHNKFCESNHLRVQARPTAPGKTRSINEKQYGLIDEPTTRQARFAPPPISLPSLRPISTAGRFFAPSGILSQGSSAVAQNPIRFPVPDAPKGPKPGSSGKVVVAGQIQDEAVTHDKLALNSIQNPNIMDAAVTTVKIHRNAVDSIALGYHQITSEKLANGAVGGKQLSNDAVLTRALAQGAVRTMALADGGIGAGEIGAESIFPDHLFDNVATSDRLAPRAIKKDNLAFYSVTVNKLSNDALNTNTLGDGSVTKKKIAFRAIGEGHLGFGAVTSNNLGSNSVLTNHLAHGSITSMKLANGALDNSDFELGAITTKKISNEAVTTSRLALGAVTGNKMRPEMLDTKQITDGSIPINKIDARVISDALEKGSVTTEKMMDREIGGNALGEDSVTTIKIASGGVSVSDLADGAVTKRKLVVQSLINDHFAKGAVTTNNIANEAIESKMLGVGSVTNLKMGDFAVEADHIDVQAVTLNKMGSEAVGTSAIVDGSVTAKKVANGVVTHNHLSGQVRTRQIRAEAVTGKKIGDGAIYETMVPVDAVDSFGLGKAITSDKLAGAVIMKKNVADNGTVAHAFDDNSVKRSYIADGAVGGENFARNAVQNKHMFDTIFSDKKIADGGIGPYKIEKLAVDTQQHFIDNTIGANEYTNPFDRDSITYDKLAVDSISADKLGTDSVLEQHLVNKKIFTADKIADGAVTGLKIADKAILTSHLVDAAVTSRALASEAITANAILDNMITHNKIAENTLITPNFDHEVVTIGKLADGTILTGNLQNDVVTRKKIQDNAVRGLVVGQQAVTYNKIVSPNVVSSEKLQDQAVQTRHIADQSVINIKFATGSVDSDAIRNFNVLTHHLIELTVSESKIADNTIVTRNIMDREIVQGKFAPNSILEQDFADLVVDTPKIKDGSIVARHWGRKNVTRPKLEKAIIVDNLQFAERTIEGRSIMDLTITTKKIKDATMLGHAFAKSAVTNDKITGVVAITRTIADRGIDVTKKIEKDGVTTAKIADNGVDSDALAEASVIVNDMDKDAIENRHFADGGATGDGFGTKSVTSAKLQDNSIGTEQIEDKGIPAEAIAKLAVGREHIKDKTVTETDFQDGLFTTSWIKDGEVVNGKIGGGVTAGTLLAKVVSFDQLADGGITNWALKNLSITTDKLNLLMIGPDQIAARGVEAGAIAIGAAIAPKIAPNSTAGSSFGNLSVTLAKFTTPTTWKVKTIKYKDNDLRDENFESLAVSNIKIADGAVVGSSWANQSVTSALITSANSIPEVKLADNSIDGSRFKAEALTEVKLQKAAVTGRPLIDRSMTAAKVVAPESMVFGTTKLADQGFGKAPFANGVFGREHMDKSLMALESGGITTNSIVQSMFDDGAVGTLALADGSVTSIKIANNSVGAGQVDGLSGVFSELTTDNIKTGDVAGKSFADSSVESVVGLLTEPSFGGVGSDAFEDTAIQINDIMDSTIVGRHIANEVVDETKLTDSAVENAAVDNNAGVQSIKFQDQSIRTADLASRTVTENNIADQSVRFRNIEIFVQNQFQVSLDKIGAIKLSIDIKNCVKPEGRPAGTQSHMSVLAMPPKLQLVEVLMRAQQPRTMEGHNEFCAKHGLGRALKEMRNTMPTVEFNSSPSHTPLSVFLIVLCSFVVACLY